MAPQTLQRKTVRTSLQDLPQRLNSGSQTAQRLNNGSQTANLSGKLLRFSDARADVTGPRTPRAGSAGRLGRTRLSTVNVHM